MNSLRKVLTAVSLMACTAVSQAAPITLNGDHFTITYDDALVGVFGNGQLSGSLDTAYFQPTSYFALSGGGLVSQMAGLQLTLTVNPGYALTGLVFTERGDYFLSNGGQAGVAAQLAATNQATSASATLDLASGPLATAGGSTPWAISGNLSLLGLGNPQTVLLSLNNTLSVTPTSGLGFIQETYAGFRVQTTRVSVPAAVPEPSSVALMLAGVGSALMLGMMRTRGQARKRENVQAGQA